MIRKNVFLGLSFVLLISISLSGCLEQYFVLDNGTVQYSPGDTKVEYVIKYGYKINCTGNGKYEIEYDCNKANILIGNVSQSILYNKYFNETKIGENTIVSWNISGKNSNNYILGINATVNTEGFLVSDLNGDDSLTIQELEANHGNIVDQYCNEQSNETFVFIDPNNPIIENTAKSIRKQVNSSNVFLLAKNLFVWLKQHTSYKTHLENKGIQPAGMTIQKETGDCDDLSFLYISLCRAIDVPARFVRGYLVENNSGVLDAVSHVWAEVFVGGGMGFDGWIPVECACNSSDLDVQIHQNFGVEDVGHLRLFVDDGSNESISMITSEVIRIRRSEDIEIVVDDFVDVKDYIVLESGKLVIDDDKNRVYN